MGNPFIPLSKAAIKADMSKNEGLIYIVLAMQTIGYRKITDNLTDKRLAQLTGIRLDHLRPCLERFLQYGLFERIEHKHYDYQYRLCDEFLDEGAATIIYPPSLPASPATGESAPRSGSFTEDGGHTTENPYIKKQQHKTNTSIYQKQQQTKPKKNKIKKQQTKPKKNISQQQPQAAVTISMAGLEKMPDHFVIESSQPVRIEFSAENIGKAATVVEQESVQPTIELATEKSSKVTTEIEQESLQPAIAETVPKSEDNEESEKITESVAMPIMESDACTTTATPIADLAVSVATTMVQSMETPSASPPEEPPVVVNEKKRKKPLAIPNIVGEENFNACNRYFDLLKESQKQDVLDVFFYNLKLGNIRNKASYFIGLTEKVKKGNLTVPSKATIKSNAVSQGPLSYEQSIAKKSADKKYEDYASQWGDYMWVQRQAKTLQKSEEEVAKMMGLEEAYMMFSEKVKAQQKVLPKCLC